jgi:hypothetical protein
VITVTARKDGQTVTRMYRSMDMAVVWSEFMRRAGYETEVGR